MLAVAVVVVVVSALFIALCGCPKKKALDLDTDTPLPPVVQVQTTPPAPDTGDGNLYDEATTKDQPQPPTSEISDSNYEDLGANAPGPADGAAAVVARSHAGKGLPSMRSTTDMGITAKRSSHTVHDMKIQSRHSLHHMDSTTSGPPDPRPVEPSMSRTGIAAAMSSTVLNKFDCPPDEDEPPPPVPQKTEAAEILYDVGPGAGPSPPSSNPPPGAPVTPPATKAPAPPSSAPLQSSQTSSIKASQSVESLSWRQQSPHKAMSRDQQTSLTWIQGQNKIDEDDGPPPPVPQKTAEAQMIYGETIPVASPTANEPPNQPMVRQESIPGADSKPTSLTKQQPVSDEEDDEAAPCLPPKTAEAEELYDYAGPNGTRKLSEASKAKQPAMADNGMEYTEVTFSMDSAAKAKAPAPAPAVNPPEESSVYADLSFQ